MRRGHAAGNIRSALLGSAYDIEPGFRRNLPEMNACPRHLGQRDIAGKRDSLGLDPRSLQYHDLRPERSLFARMGAEVLVDPADAARATGYPPTDTRAFFRGRCLALWPDRVVAANWDSMVFDVGGEALRRVPMMEPSRGTQQHVGTLLETCGSVEELLERLSA